ASLVELPADVDILPVDGNGVDHRRRVVGTFLVVVPDPLSHRRPDAVLPVRDVVGVDRPRAVESSTDVDVLAADGDRVDCSQGRFLVRIVLRYALAERRPRVRPVVPFRARGGPYSTGCGEL